MRRTNYRLVWTEMTNKSYFYCAMAIVLMIANVAFSMQQAPESETEDMFTVGILKKGYEELRELPEQRRQTFFPHLPDHEIIQWFHVLGVDKNATQDEILAAVASLMANLSPADQYPQEVYAVIKAQADAFNVSEFKVGFNDVQQHSGLYAIREASLDDIMLPEDQERLTNIKSLMGTWKRFYMFKVGFLSLIFLGPELCKYLQESEGYESIKESEWFKKMVDLSKYVKGKTDSWLGKVCLFGAFGIYPILRFWKLNASFVSDYRYHTIDFRDGLRVFFRKKFSHSVHDRYDPIRRTEYRTNFYNVTYPIGYMWDKDVRKEFMPIRKANVMKVLTWFSSALLGGFLLVL